MPRTLVVGDSHGVGTVPHLRQLLGGQVDADVRVGRSSADGVQAMTRKGGHYDRVLLDLGTNDGTAEQLRASVQRAKAHAGGARVFVATVRGPNAASKNRMLRGLSGVTLVDWAGHSDGLVGGDGIHATSQGYEQRARLLAAQMHGVTAAAPTARAAPGAANPQLLAFLQSTPTDSRPFIARMAALGKTRP